MTFPRPTHHSRSAKRPLKARKADAAMRASRNPHVAAEDLARWCDLSLKQAREVLSACAAMLATARGVRG